MSISVNVLLTYVWPSKCQEVEGKQHLLAHTHHSALLPKDTSFVLSTIFQHGAIHTFR